MNKLAGGAGCGFKVSNKQDPCTVGVDLASNTVSLKAFCAVEGSAPPPPRYVPPPSPWRLVAVRLLWSWLLPRHRFGCSV